MKIGAVAWACTPCRSVSEYLAHAKRVLSLTDGCDVAVWPEQTSLELLGGAPDLPPESVATHLAGLFEEIRTGLCDLVARSGQTLLAGTHFVPSHSGPINAPLWIGGDGDSQVLPGKNVLTQYEVREWGITPGRGLAKVGRVGALVCYDSEFPGAGRALAEAGAHVLAVPYFTQDRYGYQRVLWSGLARAVELQVFVVQAGLVGGLGCEPVPHTYGQAAVLTPSLEGFPADSRLAETPLGEEGAAIATLDFDRLLEARETGDVRNWNDRDRGDWTVTFRG